MTERLDYLSTELFRDLASNAGAWSGLTPNHTNMMFHQIVLVSTGNLAAGEYKVRINVREGTDDLEATIDTGVVLTMTGKNSAIGFFTGSVSGVHLEVSTPLSAGEKITAILSSTNADMRPAAEIPTSSIDHGGLGGLTDNDHTQYLNAVTDTASLDLTKTGQSVSGVVLPAGVDHDSLQNFVGDKHVAHSGVSMTAGVGLSGGGDISSNRTFTLDLNELSVSVADLDGDFFAVVDSAGAQYKLTKANIALTGFNNDALWADDQTAAEIRALVAAALDSNVYTDAESTKMGFISITQAVDLDAIETRVNALDASVILMGAFDASVGAFPGSGTAQAGESWIASVGGTIDGVVITANDRVVAILDNASTTTYASNWHLLDYTDQVLSVAGKTGAVTLVEADITDLQSYAVIGGAHHDSFSDYVADEHQPSSAFASASHTIASHSDTTATGAELETLTDNSIADALHRHSELVASDGLPDPVVSVDAAGNVGMGTTTPKTQLHLFAGEGTAIADASTSVMRLERHTSGGNQVNAAFEMICGLNKKSQIRLADTATVNAPFILRWDVGAQAFVFIHAGAERMRVEATGNVGIGTTSPGVKLQVAGDCDVTGVFGHGVHKAADETITSDATLSDDADLTVAVLANTNYRADIVLLFDSGATPDFQFKITVPTSATFLGIVQGKNSLGDIALGAGSVDEGVAITIAGGTSTTGRVVVTGTFRVAGTAGNVVIQWAQNTSDASNTTLLEGSHIILTKLL